MSAPTLTTRIDPDYDRGGRYFNSRTYYFNQPRQVLLNGEVVYWDAHPLGAACWAAGYAACAGIPAPDAPTGYSA